MTICADRRKFFLVKTLHSYAKIAQKKSIGWFVKSENVTFLKKIEEIGKIQWKIEENGQNFKRKLEKSGKFWVKIDEI